MLLRALNFQAVNINGQLSQHQRLAALNKFKAGDCSILIATDVASRGLDIPAVNVVINFDIPNNSKDYVHRVGRTARAGKTGRAITVVTQYDIEVLQRTEELIGKKLVEYHDVEKDKALILEEAVTEASRIAAMELRTQEKRKGKDTGDDADNGERNADMALFGKKRNHG